MRGGESGGLAANEDYSIPSIERAVDGRRDCAQRPGRGAGRHGTDPSTSLRSAQDDGGEGSLRGGELGGLAANEDYSIPSIERAVDGRRDCAQRPGRGAGRHGTDPSTSLGSAQDDGGEGSLRGGELGGLAANERLFDPKHRAGGGRQARLRATARPGGE